MAALTDEDRRILHFAAKWWRSDGARDESIIMDFDMTPNRYFQRLNTLIDRPEAFLYAPSTVKRLQAMREERSRTRSLRRRGISA